MQHSTCIREIHYGAGSDSTGQRFPLDGFVLQTHIMTSVSDRYLSEHLGLWRVSSQLLQLL